MMEEGLDISEDFLVRANKAIEELIPTKSRAIYDKEFKIFVDWKLKNGVTIVNETVMMAYFQELVIALSLKEVEDDDVEIEVHFCGLNFADLYTRLGLFPKEEKPFVLGIECSGIVRAIGKKVTHFKVDDRVVCYNYHGGLHRASIIIPSTKCYPIPDSIPLRTAAAAFVAFLTAHCSLFEAGSLQPGHQVLVQSCAGAVGSAAIQLARTVPQVTTWGTTSDVAKVTPGAVDHVVTHDAYLEDVPCGSLDLIVDNQACRGYEENLKLLKPFGRIVVTGANYMIKDNKLQMNAVEAEAGSPLPQLIAGSVSVGGLHLGQVAERAPERLQVALNHIWDLLATGKVSACVDSVWELDTAGVRHAMSLLQERRNRGKVLLRTPHAKELN